MERFLLSNMSAWKKIVHDYFIFSKKDRVGITVLLLLIVLVALLPCAWPDKKSRARTITEIASIKKQFDALKPVTGEKQVERDSSSTADSYTYPRDPPDHERKTVMFYFDPNTLDKQGWISLGIREKTAGTITNYLAKGGRFRKPEDLGKIYGLSKNDYERLLPWVKIPGNNQSRDGWASTEKKERFAEKPISIYHTAEIVRPPVIKQIEINTADSGALIALRGIGSKLAARILHFRDKLGGFYDVQQVGETFGLPDSSFNQIKDRLLCNAAAVQQININTADANTLKQHPYIRWNIANAIVQYRAQHGSFRSVDDLQFIAPVTPEIFEKLRRYVKV